MFIKKHNLYDLNKVNSTIKYVKSHFKKHVRGRDLVISPTYAPSVLSIHKGNKYNKIRITEFMVGHKLGEFSFTRKPFKYPIKKKKKNFIRR
jgi:ribosomal protein S19